MSSPAVVLQLYIQKKHHPKLIGTGGSVVKKLQADHAGVRVKIPGRDEDSSCVEVSGPSNDVVRACKGSIEAILGFPASASPFSKFELTSVEKKRHGALIGKGGVVLRQLEADSGCSINIPGMDNASDVIKIEGTKGAVRFDANSRDRSIPCRRRRDSEDGC